MKRKNPLIPMGAITGNLTKEEIRTMMRRYADAGIRQYLMYPRDGCDVPYMSERWLEILGDIIETAAELDIDIWLYDEFNWPSGTCKGMVMAENEDYFCHRAVIGDNGVISIVRTETYADILNPDAVDCFLRLTHDVYYKRYKPYFGTVIKGIFTDEPGIRYYAEGRDFPYAKGIEKDYFELTGRDLFHDMAHADGDFLDAYYEVLGKRFRTAFVDKIGKWCAEHGILMTGHLLAENHLATSCRCSGNGIHALRGFTLPGMDEIGTITSIDRAEWLTFGTVQAAIRTGGNGGLVETFALGPTDLPPARVEQMLWLEAMYNIDHYVLAVAAADARGNVKKNGWFNPMNYMNPWFEGYAALGASAMEAAEYAGKTIAADVCVRVPYHACRRVCRAEGGEHDAISGNLDRLLSALTKAQYQWILLDEDEEPPVGIPVLTVDNRDDDCAKDAVEAFAKTHPRARRILQSDGTCPDDLMLREFTDGTSVILDLSDSDESRTLVFAEDGKPAVTFTIGGRGHLVFRQGESFPVPRVYETISAPSPDFRLTLDHRNTLRCNIRSDKTEFTFRAETDLADIRILIRQYMYDGAVYLDGKEITADRPAAALTPGLSSLYLETEPFCLGAGGHTVHVNEPAKSEPFLPSVFLSGSFAATVTDGTDILYPLPKKVPFGRLDAGSSAVLPQYAGKVTLEASVDIPDDAEALLLDVCGLYTKVSLNGVLIGDCLRDFIYPIPPVFRGSNAVVKIEEYTSIAPAFGRREDVVAGGDGETWTPLEQWFPYRYKAVGIKGMRFVK
ncbi:MAG: hypothetical protein MJ175_11140 [Clostridia bacterium]|nr:hypothetical protein [Clostridia bacterium]